MDSVIDCDSEVRCTVWATSVFWFNFSFLHFQRNARAIHLQDPIQIHMISRGDLEMTPVPCGRQSAGDMEKMRIQVPSGREVCGELEEGDKKHSRVSLMSRL